MRATVKLAPEMPRLGWVAEVSRKKKELRITHGPSVECHSSFVVEGVWSGEFDQGDFHAAPHFFGSGVRWTQEEVWLCPSSALVDRIVYREDDNCVIASNSLPLLLAATGAQFSEDCDFKQESFALLKGLGAIPREMRISDGVGGAYFQTYHHPIRICNGEVQHRNRPVSDARLDGFESLLEAMRSELTALTENAKSASRRHPMALFSTISAGYDSTAVTALTERLGLTAAYTSQKSNSSILAILGRAAANDDGTPIAERLQVPVRYLGSSRDTTIGPEELEFLCATSAEAESVFAVLAADMLQEERPSLLFTGYHGDKAWDADPGEKYLGDRLLRGDTSGLNLSEIRLSSGFINTPVPFLFARRIEEINQISRSDEMKPWSVGGSYDRPIPRRIVEESGISRTQFGMRKKAVIQSYFVPRNERRRLEYHAWLKKRGGLGIASVRIRSAALFLRFVCLRTAEKALSIIGISIHPDYSVTRILGADLAGDLYRWAVEQRVRELEPLLAPETPIK